MSNEPQSSSASLIRREEIEELANFVTDEVVEILRTAAADTDLWQQILHNPRAFLQERGVKVSDNVQMILSEAPRIAIPFTGAGQPIYFPPGTCPEGLVPVLTTRVEEICTKSIEIWKCVGPPDDQFCFTVKYCLEREYKLVSEIHCVLPTL